MDNCGQACPLKCNALFGENSISVRSVEVIVFGVDSSIIFSGQKSKEKTDSQHIGNRLHAPALPIGSQSARVGRFLFRVDLPQAGYRLNDETIDHQ